MTTDINYVLASLKAHEAQLIAIFGGKSSEPPKGANGKPLTMTPKAFDTQFGGTGPITIRRK